MAIPNFKNPIRVVAINLPTKSKIMSKHFITLKDKSTGTNEERKVAKKYNNDLSDTINEMRKLPYTEFNKRKTPANSNMAALWK